MKSERVVITGIGPVSSIGTGRDEFYAACRECESGIHTLVDIELHNNACTSGAQIEDFNVDDYLESQKSYLDRSSEFAMAAMALAIEDADVDVESLDMSRTMLALGSALGSLDTMSLFFRDFITKGPRLVKPFLFQHTYANTAISLIAIEYGLSCRHMNFSSGSASAGLAIAEAFDLIRRGEINMAFVGGYEAISETSMHAYGSSGELASGESAPFDCRRSGFIPGEGAAILVLEEMEHALARGATIRGEIAGCGMASSVAEAMQQTGCNGPDLVIAAANGSQFADENEAAEITLHLGDHHSDTPVTSIKPLIGETLGASGAFQVSAALAIMDTGIVPHILHLHTPDETCGLNLVKDKALTMSPLQIVVNSVDPGGSVVSFLMLPS